jgi:DNA-binding SARP family transcriptional activator
VDFRILGPLEVLGAGRGVPLGGAKQRAALAMLLLHRNQTVSRDRLIEGLWGEKPPASAGHTLEAYVSRLRRAFLTVEPSPRLMTRPPGYLLKVEAGELDLDRFQAALDRAGTAISGGDPRAAAAALREGLAMFRGAPLEDLTYAPFAQGRSRDWRSCGWLRSSDGSMRTWRAGATGNSSVNWSRSSLAIRCASGSGPS